MKRTHDDSNTVDAMMKWHDESGLRRKCMRCCDDSDTDDESPVVAEAAALTEDNGDEQKTWKEVIHNAASHSSGCYHDNDAEVPFTPPSSPRAGEKRIENIQFTPTGSQPGERRVDVHEVPVTEVAVLMVPVHMGKDGSLQQSGAPRMAVAKKRAGCGGDPSSHDEDSSKLYKEQLVVNFSKRVIAFAKTIIPLAIMGDDDPSPGASTALDMFEADLESFQDDLNMA